MNREIKFRTYLKDYEMMVSVDYINLYLNEIIVDIKNSQYEFEIGEYELMQYTGLKDEDGAGIYEGDIVKCFTNGNSYVSFKGGVYGLIFDYTFIPFSDIHGEMRVIGNVYENPELLEVKS